MLIDYSRILTNDSELIPGERLAEIKKRADLQRRKLKMQRQQQDLVTTMYKKADEYAYISAINNDLTNEEKGLLSANIMFTNEKMAELLKNGKFDKETLKIYIDLISYIKRKMAANAMGADQEKYKTTAEKYTRKLINYFRYQIGIVNANQIINKIYEIMTYEPVLLDTENKTKNR